MEDLTLTTPALLFPTMSLLLLAYTNRYVAISNRIRVLHSQYKEEKTQNLLKQIQILKRRIQLIRDMQLAGITCMFFAAFTMFLIFVDLKTYSTVTFTISLLILMISLSMSAYEIVLSNKALYIQIKDMEFEMEQ
ncbi:MAG: DUF2721 domain-containing protein [Cytophagales bacterium]|nr:MAG: DUF2721 domain-containing protein [Cytophagales bacterium]